MLSSGLSATYQSACTAAETVADRIPVRVVDTQSVTMGQGLLVLAAADMAPSGAVLDEIAAALEDMKGRTHVYGVIDSLDYLRRGGRIGGRGAARGLVAVDQARHPRASTGWWRSSPSSGPGRAPCSYLANKAIEAGPLERLGAANGAAPDFDEVLEMLRKATTDHELVIGDLGPVVGSHAGPASVGVCFITKSH